MRKALLLAPMASVHRRFNKANISALQNLGFKVELCANFANREGSELSNQKFKQECEAAGILCHSFPFERHSLTACLKILPSLKTLLCKEQYDIIHAHTETGGLLLRLIGKTYGKKFYTPHGMSFWKGSSIKSHLLYKPLEKWICRAMYQNLGMNKEEFEYLNKWNSQSANYIHGVGLDVNKMQKTFRERNIVREEFCIEREETMIVSIGELNDNKNHITVIKALANIKRKDYKYIICGIDPNENMILHKASALGIKENVILAGYRSDIPDILNAADLFVLPSFHEGMPVSLLEAMTVNLPIICSQIRGNTDVIKDKVNGFLFDPKDTETLSKRISDLMDKPEMRKAMGENRKTINSYSLDIVIKELETIYSKSILAL